MSTAHARPPDPLAPWAEIVPTISPVTVAVLLTMPDDGYTYEVVEGVLVRVAGSGDTATTSAFALGAAIHAHARSRRLGVVTGADGVYRFLGSEKGLIPDVGYYIAKRRALISDGDKPLPFAPDIVIEVASPSQTARDMAVPLRGHAPGMGCVAIW